MSRLRGHAVPGRGERRRAVRLPGRPLLQPEDAPRAAGRADRERAVERGAGLRRARRSRAPDDGPDAPLRPRALGGPVPGPHRGVEEQRRATPRVPHAGARGPRVGGGVTRPRTVVALAASAGGFHALLAVLTALPSDVPAAFAVVQHLQPSRPSLLAELLGRRCELEVRPACQGDALREGLVLVAPPDHHLLVTPAGAASLTTTELVHFVRPSADLLFESVAAAFGTSAVAVVLSGTGVDGSLGVAAIRERGGTVLAQRSAEFDGMPAAAVATGIVDRVVSLDGIGPAILDIVEHAVSR